MKGKNEKTETIVKNNFPSKIEKKKLEKCSECHKITCLYECLHENQFICFSCLKNKQVVNLKEKIEENFEHEIIFSIELT